MGQSQTRRVRVCVHAVLPDLKDALHTNHLEVHLVQALLEAS